MNGAAGRLPKHAALADVPDSSISISKGSWWKYLHSAQRSSPAATRLLLVLLLSAQVIFLAIIRLGSGGPLWTLDSREGLASSPSSATSEYKHSRPELAPHRATEFPVLKAEGESSVSLVTPSSLSPLSSFSLSSLKSVDDASDSLASTEMTPTHTESSNDPSSTEQQKDLAESSDFNAVATTVSLDAVKKDQALIAEKVFEKPGNGGAKHSSVGTRHDITNADETINSRDKEEHSLNGTADEHGEFASTALYDVRNAHVPSADEETASSSQCRYGYVYAYDLPPMFNHDIIENCTALNVFLNVCDTLLNDGLGPSLGDASPLGQMASWYRSDQFTAEIVFHKRMLQHPCLTDKPEKATSFYVPYYAGLDVGRYLWSGFSAERRDRVSNQLLEWLVDQLPWKRNRGWGHFLMIGRISWDFRRSKDEDWGSGFFYHPWMRNMTRLLIEKNPWDYMEMAVPYPTNFHPQSDADLVAWQTHIRGLQRSSLFSFAGAPRSSFPNDFRSILLDQCHQAKSCRSLDCSNRACDNNHRTLELFMGSAFCLQPRGDSFTRRSTFDCLLAGSIPVFFWHRSAYMQYKWHLPEDAGSYSVFISKDAIRNGTRIEDVLRSISTEKVQRMQEVVIEMVPRIVYAASSSALKNHQDAFDVAVEGVMRRFKEELHLSSQMM